MDTYLRLDQTISDLLSFLDSKIGEVNYLLFLTSDHGAIETPSFIKKNNSTIGELNTRSFYD